MVSNKGGVEKHHGNFFCLDWVFCSSCSRGRQDAPGSIKIPDVIFDIEDLLEHGLEDLEEFAAGSNDAIDEEMRKAGAAVTTGRQQRLLSTPRHFLMPI